MYCLDVVCFKVRHSRLALNYSRRLSFVCIKLINYYFILNFDNWHALFLQNHARTHGIIGAFIYDDKRTDRSVLLVTIYH